jgi:hypothetical protein
MVSGNNSTIFEANQQEREFSIGWSRKKTNGLKIFLNTLHAYYFFYNFANRLKTYAQRGNRRF